jgi:tripartite-type tricarboxylate transporter receptor subunit TctC
MRTAIRSVCALLIGIAGSLALPDPLLAEAWPRRTVKLIIPLPAGVSVDVSARLFAEQLAARWGHPVIIENMPGADGILAVKEFISRGDQHTLLYSFAGLITINPLLHEKLPYDPTRDLVPIAASSDNFLAIAVSSKLHAASLSQLVTLARSHPTKFNWVASPGLPFFALSGFQKSERMATVYVPYRDFNSAIVDLGEGRIDIAAASLTGLMPQQQAGKVRVLAVMNKVRSPAAPDVPTAAEAGYPQLTFDGVTGFYGWREIPGELRDRIAADVRAVAESTAIKERLAKIGIVARGSTPSEFAAAIEEQRAKVAAIAAAIGTKPSQ